MCLNLNGSLVDKLECPEFIELVSVYDVIMLSETWTNEKDELGIDDFEKPFCKHRDRKVNARRDSGGLCVFFRKCIVKGISEVPWDFEDGMCFKLDKCYFGWKEDMYLLCVYMRPEYSSRADLDVDNDIYELVEQQIAKVSELGDVMCMGDFNARVAEKMECYIENDSADSDVFDYIYSPDHAFKENDFIVNNMSIKRNNVDKNVNSYGGKLLLMCYSCNLAILNGRAGNDRGIGEYTFMNHRGVSANDYVLCDKNTLYKVCQFEIGQPNCFSDHMVVSFELGVNFDLDTVDNDREQSRPSRIYVKWEEGKKGDYVDQISSEYVEQRVNVLMESLKGNRNVNKLDEVIGEVTGLIVEAGSCHMKSRYMGEGRGRRGEARQKVKGGKWYDEECRIQKCKFSEQRDVYFMTGEENDRLKMCVERSIYRKMCRTKRAEFNRNEARKLIDLSKTNPKVFWKDIQKKSGKKKENDLPNIDFFGHFSKLAGRESMVGEEGRKEIEEEIEKDRDVCVDELDRPITMQEVEATIKELGSDKSAGHDNIINEFIVNASPGIKLIILSIFNNILELEYFPSLWSVGNIVPIFKKGGKTDLNNYRGITLLSCMAKLFTRLLNNRLSDWAENENKISNSQYGFRKGRGTTDCIFILKGLIDLMIARGKKLYALFVDYEKAYDYLDRSAVFYKLYKNGVSSKCINVLRSLYSNIKLNVRGCTNDNYFTSSTGLLQGESTSPLIFSFYVSDLEYSFSDDSIGVDIVGEIISLLMFADDTIIFSQTYEGLQSGIDSLWNYCTKWGLTVNTNKTKIVVFRKGGKLKAKEKWNYGGIKIDTLSSFKYLGCSISVKGSFNKCIEDLATSARRALFCLKKCVSNYPDMSPKLQIQLFNTMILPILSYGSEIWGQNKAIALDVVHMSFLKSILRVKTSTPNCFVYGELGVYPLFIDRHVKMIKYWLKVITVGMSTDNIVGKVYKELFYQSIEKPHVVTWCTQIRDLLESCGFGYVWLNQSVYNHKEFVSMFTQRVTDMYLQEWKVNVSSTSKNRLYQYIKTEFKYESYLNLESSIFRISISRIRLSSHLFLIERGRWGKKRIQIDKRKCTLCNVTEDEFHCLLKCPRFNNERNNCLTEELHKNPNMYLFNKFLNSDSIETQKKLALLCLKVQKEHRQYI